LFSASSYYSEFQALEAVRYTPLTDKMSLYFFDLKSIEFQDHPPPTAKKSPREPSFQGAFL
jgi:hypothetical protein